MTDRSSSRGEASCPAIWLAARCASEIKHPEKRTGSSQRRQPRRGRTGKSGTQAALRLVPEPVTKMRTAPTMARNKGSRLFYSAEGHTVCVLPDGRLAPRSHDKAIRLWNVRSGAETDRIEIDDPALCLVAFAQASTTVRYVRGTIGTSPKVAELRQAPRKTGNAGKARLAAGR
jgi:hypothetical protein